MSELDVSLIRLCFMGLPDEVESLLKQGANPNFVAPNLKMLVVREHFTPLLVAVRAQKHDNVRLLLSHGADVNHIVPDSDYDDMDALCEAIKNHDMTASRMLVDAGADVHAGRGSYRASLLFYTDSNPETMRFLLELGVDPNRQDKDGDVTLRYVIDDSENINYQAVKLLLDHGADLHLENKEGTSPWMHIHRRDDIYQELKAFLASYREDRAMTSTIGDSESEANGLHF